MATAPVIDEARLKEVEARGFDESSHSDWSAGACIMEAVAYVTRSPWSDHPECVCPVIGAFLRSWNDALPDEERTALLMPLFPLVIGTRSTKEVERRRSLMAADWFIRTHTPAWLRLAKLNDQADLIAALPEITDMAQYPSLRAPLEAVRKDASAAWAAAGDAARAAARAAAWDAAGDAAWDAAWAAAGAAAGDAARDAAWAAAGAAAWAAAWAAAGDAAWDAARAAAWAAAWAAAGAAAGDAAWAALKETRAQLQASATDLVRRMCAAEAK